MDRHDLPGATAEDVAEAHARGLEVEDKHDVKFLSYWFDADNGGTFCFARAPTPENLEAAHQESHGLVPNKIIRVSEDSVVRFLGQFRDPVDYTELTSPFRTILVTDRDGSTEMAERLEASVFMSLLAEHDSIIRRSLLASGGREVKHTGDGIMASFDDVENALNCALAIQAGFSANIGEDGKPKYRVRVGMAAGEPVDRNDDLFGSTVNLASRICNAADPGDVLVSDLVHELGSTRGFSFAGGERRALKGFADPVPVFRLLSSSPLKSESRGG
jgi:class 3 adenylate cyclase